ncbi:triadin-like [Lepus europaeus]|uniref:triadin-like n=1 Tax=Lepus europaeus TaxID=9983 RepID=UPI002B487EC8|nr:triadin-like [Lepus europaeus]
MKKKEPGKSPDTKPGTVKVTTQAATKKDEKKEDSKKTKKPAEEQPKGKTKSTKKEHAAPSEKQAKAKIERKEEVSAASTKKAVPAKKEEKTTKTVEQETRKEKPGKSSSVLKDKELTKEKEVKVPTSLKEKESETKKDEKTTKPGKEVKPKPPQPQIKKEEKPEQDIMKPEKTALHGKPEEKVLKQVKAVTTEKHEKAEHQQKEPLSIKTEEGFEDVPASKKAKVLEAEKFSIKVSSDSVSSGDLLLMDDAFCVSLHDKRGSSYLESLLQECPPAHEGKVCMMVLREIGLIKYSEVCVESECKHDHRSTLLSEGGYSSQYTTSSEFLEMLRYLVHGALFNEQVPPQSVLPTVMLAEVNPDKAENAWTDKERSYQKHICRRDPEKLSAEPEDNNNVYSHSRKNTFQKTLIISVEIEPQIILDLGRKEFSARNSDNEIYGNVQQILML